MSNMDHAKNGLDASQRALLDKLLRKIHACLPPNDSGRRRAVDWERPLVLCIDGPRGSGKSTMLQELHRRLLGQQHMGNVNQQDLSDLVQSIHVPPIVDCTALPDSVSPGAAVLVRIHEDERFWGRWQAFDTRHLDTKKRALMDVADAHAESDPSYREMCLELASTPADFAHYVTLGVRDRLMLQDKLATWLQEMSQATEVKAIVVLLDDFDLLFGSSVRAWIRALLDELHQARLIFVLTADFHRLQHLSWSSEQQIDDLTGHAILNKLIPIQHRFFIDPWRPASRLLFKPRYAARGDKTLGELLAPLFLGLTSHEATIRALLPALPRGLHDLYQSLNELDLEEHKGERAATWLLPTLAQCRGESLLARRLGEVAIHQWCKVLEWQDDQLSVERWRETVRAAGAPPREGEPYPVMESVAPPAWKPERRPMLDHWTHDAEREDPTRHDQLRYDQLRDARDQDRALWVELLLNISMDDKLQGPQDNRAIFLMAWPPAAVRMESARFQVTFSQEQLWDELGNPKVPVRPLLPWFMWREDLSKTPKELVIDIGWVPFLAACRSARDPWPSELLKRLFIGPSIILGDVDTTTYEPDINVLPNRTGPLVLFTDALHRCPWGTYAGPHFGWQLLTYVRLARAFVQTAYVHALLQRTLFQRDHFGPTQRFFLDQLGRKDPVLLRYKADEQSQKGNHESRIIAALDELDQERVLSKLNDKSDALSRAAKHFLTLTELFVAAGPTSP